MKRFSPSSPIARPLGRATRFRLVTTERAVLAAAVMLVHVISACAGTPQFIGALTPVRQDEVYGIVLRKVRELGYAPYTSDIKTGIIEAQKPSGDGRSREDLYIRVFPQSEATKLEITASKVLSGSADQPAARRVAPSRQTTADANAILQLFLFQPGDRPRATP